MENLSKYYTLLKDPTRRKIIEILGAQEKIGFKELRETLGLGVGTVYYHLDMLSDFIAQDKQRKYRLNDRGRTLYRILKEGSIPATLEITEAFSHRLGRWLFLSPVFAKTANSLRFLPFSISILLMGAYGSAYAELDPALFFYFYISYFNRSFITTALLFIFNWLGLFLFAEFFAYLLYKRAGNELQLFACIGIAAIPMAAYPYIYLAIPAVFPNLGTMKLNTIMQGILTVLQIWSLLLVSAALCFGKGLRLDKAIVISLTAVYLNMAALFLLGRFT